MGDHISEKVRESCNDDVVTTVYKLKNPKGKVKTVTIEAPEDTKVVYERYAFAINDIFSRIAPNNYQEALKIANDLVSKGQWVD